MHPLKILECESQKEKLSTLCSVSAEVFKSHILILLNVFNHVYYSHPTCLERNKVFNIHDEEIKIHI